MADVHDSRTRSYNMSQIKGKDTKPEMIVRKFLHAHGFRYRLHDRRIPGKPDITLKKYNTIIEINGCFWHMHDCEMGRVKSPSDSKVSRNRISAAERDKRNYRLWSEMGWRVLLIWECELQPRIKSSEKRNKTLNQLLADLTNADSGN